MDGILAILWIIGFAIYMKFMEDRKNNAIDHYDLNKVDNTKLTKDMDKPLRVREQNLLAGKYDFKEGEYNYKTGKRM